MSACDYEELMDQAIAGKDDAAVDRLLPLLSDESIPFSLFSAVVHQNTYAVRALAKKSGTTENNHTLGVAVGKRYLEGVEIMLPISDPTYDQSCCLQRAVLNRDWDMFELLYPLSDASEALKGLKDSAQIQEQPQRQDEPLFVELVNRVLHNKLAGLTTDNGIEARPNKI